MKKLYKKTTVYVVRRDKNDKLQNSSPCQDCLVTIIDLKVKRLVFSSFDNTFVSCIPSDLIINHVSSGNRHLVKSN
jgi:tRNA(Arg) A34 adenosine deaminase TadA